MRDKDKPASLNELLGSGGCAKTLPEMKLGNLKEILGEKMPELPANRIGKYRLVQALKVRFGPGFRNIPGVADIVKEFDSNVDTENTIKANLEARNG